MQTLGHEQATLIRVGRTLEHDRSVLADAKKRLERSVQEVRQALGAVTGQVVELGGVADTFIDLNEETGIVLYAPGDIPTGEEAIVPFGEYTVVAVGDDTVVVSGIFEQVGIDREPVNAARLLLDSLYFVQPLPNQEL